MKKPDIVASEGMWLTNGEAFTKSVYLGNNDSAENWYEISQDEYDENKNKEEIFEK